MPERLKLENQAVTRVLIDSTSVLRTRLVNLFWQKLYLYTDLQACIVALQVDGLQQHPDTPLQNLQPRGSPSWHCPVVLEAHGMKGQHSANQLSRLQGIALWFSLAPKPT